LIATTTLGGKAGCPPAAWLFVKPREAVSEEAVSPLTDDLAWRIEACGNRIVAQAGCGEQHDLGSHDITMR
jgi:hypothetical protein